MLRATERFWKACAQDPLAESVVVLPMAEQIVRGDLPAVVRLHFPDGKVAELRLVGERVVADLVEHDEPRGRVRRQRDRRGRFVWRRGG